MRSYLIAFVSLAALSAAVATPAAAQGFRAEIHGGWDHPSVAGIHDDGIVYGVGLGYDMNIGSKAFVGIDLSADLSSQQQCERSVVVANDKLCEKAGRDLAAGIRAGVNVTPQDKIYVLAGYTNARFKSAYTVGTTTSRGADNLDGFRLGAGYQRQLAGNFYGKVEYRYSNYESGVDRHQVLAGVGVAF